MREIAPGIWCWQRRPRGLRPGEFGARTSYAVTAGGETLLVDPLVTGEDDPALGALVTDVALAAQERPPTDESVLRMSILQLEQRRIDREIRRALQEGDHARQSQLAAEGQKVLGELASVMGQTA